MLPIRDHNPSGRIPFVTYALILANVAVFLGTLHLQSNQNLLYQHYLDYALVPALISRGEGFEGFVTSMFLHGGWMHLGGNMLFLFIFGDNVEDEMGHVPYALFYLVSGLGAGIAQYLAAPLSPIPTVGASGAIAGVMGGYLLLFPKARVDIFVFLIIIFRIFPLPAWVVLAIWFAMQVSGGFNSSASEGGVAYWAHAGGFVAGLVLTIPLWQRLGGTGFWTRTHGHPPHPETRYRSSYSRIPRIPRR